MFQFLQRMVCSIAGYGDCCYCYFCGIGLRHWTQMDDPWIEHARWRPSCYYVLAHQGQHFIDAALEMTRNDRHVCNIIESVVVLLIIINYKL